MHKIHSHVPELSVKPERPETNSQSLLQTVKAKAKFFVNGWKLFVQQSVFIPGLVLAILYINVLGMSFPLQGF